MLRGNLEAHNRSYADLRQLSDQLSLALAEVRQAGSQQQAALDDLDSSASALAAERRLLELRVERARLYSQGVRDRLRDREEDNATQTAKLQRGQNIQAAAAAVLLLSSSTQQTLSDTSSSVGSSDALDIICPESSGSASVCT